MDVFEDDFERAAGVDLPRDDAVFGEIEVVIDGGISAM